MSEKGVSHAMNYTCWWYICLVLCVITGCAQISMPSGGPIDKIGPSLDSSEMKSLIFLNFPKIGEERKIELVFNEYIRVNNPSKEIFVSPPLKTPPLLTGIGLEAILTLPSDTLIDNTTYIINLGNAIVDLNEGNSSEPLEIILSTGNKVDSNELEVRVLQLIDKAPVDRALVMLYQSPKDSVIYNENPTYVGRTDKRGKVTLRYMKTGTYQLYALVDKNIPYRYDIETEAIGFLDQPVAVNDSSGEHTVYVFTEPTTNIFTAFDSYGLKHVVTLKNDALVDYRVLDSEAIVQSYQVRDSLIFWQNVQCSLEKFNVRLEFANSRIDTLSFKTKIDKNATFPLYLKLKGGKSSVKILPNTPISWTSNTPIKRLQKEYIRVIDTSKNIAVPYKMFIDTAQNSLAFHMSVESQKDVRIELLPNAVINLYGETNDTIINYAQVFSKDELSNTIITLKDLDSTQHYIVEIEQREEKIYDRTIQGVDMLEIALGYILPTQLKVAIYFDDNKNGKYDPPSFRRRDYGEEKIKKEVTGMKPNWDFSYTIKPHEKN